MKKAVLIAVFLYVLAMGLRSEEYALAQNFNDVSEVTFRSDTEYNRWNIIDDREAFLFFNMTRIGIPVKNNLEVDIKVAKADFDGDYLLYGIGNQTLKFNAAQAMLKWKMDKEWYAGVALKYNDYTITPVKSEKSLLVEVGRNYPTYSGLLSGRGFLTECLGKSRIYSPLELETSFHNIGKEFGFFDHLFGYEVSFLSNRQPENKTVPVQFPLLLSPDKTFMIDMKGYYNFTDDKSYNDGTDYTNPEMKLDFYYKSSRWLALDLNWSYFLWDEKDESNHCSTRTLDSKIGLASNVLRHKGLDILLKGTFRYNENYSNHKHDMDTDWSYSYHTLSAYRFIVPAFILSYELNDNLMLNGMVSRNYYVGKPESHTSYLVERNWDGSLAMSVGF